METSPQDQFVRKDLVGQVGTKYGSLIRREVLAMQEPMLTDLWSLGGGATQQQMADVIRKHINVTFDRIDATLGDIIDQAANSAPLA